MKIILFVLFCLLGQEARSDAVRISGYLGTMGFFVPPRDLNSSSLQAGVAVDYRLDLTYLLGDKEGFLIGLGYDADRVGYGQSKGDRAGSLNSDEYYILGKFGYWWKYFENSMVQVSMDYGPGQINLYPINNTFQSGSTSAQLLDIKCDLIYPVGLGGGPKIDLIGGFGLYRKIVSPFNLDGYGYSQDDFKNQFILLQVGAGFRF